VFFAELPLDCVVLRAVPEDLGDEDLLQMVNAGLLPTTVVNGSACVDGDLGVNLHLGQQFAPKFRRPLVGLYVRIRQSFWPQSTSSLKRIAREPCSGSR
jgi:hypothetical protein